MTNPIRQTLGAITLVVRNYDEAIAYFTQVLGFTLVEDTDLLRDSGGLRGHLSESVGSSTIDADGLTTPSSC